MSELVRTLDEVRDAAQAELEEEEHRPLVRAPPMPQGKRAVVRALLVPRPVGDEFRQVTRAQPKERAVVQASLSMSCKLRVPVKGRVRQCLVSV